MNYYVLRLNSSFTQPFVFGDKEPAPTCSGASLVGRVLITSIYIVLDLGYDDDNDNVLLPDKAARTNTPEQLPSNLAEIYINKIFESIDFGKTFN